MKIQILATLMSIFSYFGIAQSHTHAELQEKIKPIFRIAQQAFTYLSTPPPVPKGIKMIQFPEENPFFDDMRMIGKEAGNILEWLIREPSMVESYENSNRLLGSVFKRVKTRIGHCYTAEDKYIMKQALIGDYDYDDPVTKEFMVIVNGVNQLKELLEKEGYMKHIEDKPHSSWTVERSLNNKEFWFFKLLESKAFLRIICGMMNVEWDLLGNAFVSKLHYVKE